MISTEPRVRCRSPFFIAFMGRSGSTHLYHLLNQHPEICCHKEDFNPHLFRGPKSPSLKNFVRRNAKRLIGRKRLIPLKLMRIYGASTPPARGFQLKFGQGRDAERFPEVLDWLLAQGDRIKCIVLYRENHLRGAISNQNFKRIKALYRSANIPGDNGQPLSGLEVDLDKAIAETRERERTTAWIRETMPHHFETLEISYEALAQNEKDVLDQCIRFLGVQRDDRIKAEARTRKASGEHLADYVANYTALEERAIAEGMEHYL